MKQSSKVTVIRPAMKKTDKNVEFSINSLKLGPAGTDLSVDVKADKNNLTFDPYLDLDFKLVDEQGNVLREVNQRGSGENIDDIELATLEILYTPIKAGTKEVTVLPNIPPSIDVEHTLSISINKDKLPVTLDQGDAGKIHVTDIQHMEDKTIVYFKVESDYPYGDLLTQNETWLETKEGTKLSSKNNPYAIRVEGNLYKQEFKSSNHNQLVFKAYKLSKPVLFEEFMIQLP